MVRRPEAGPGLHVRRCVPSAWRVVAGELSLEGLGSGFVATLEVEQPLFDLGEVGEVGEVVRSEDLALMTEK